jgi:hypothetical protein
MAVMHAPSDISIIIFFVHYFIKHSAPSSPILHYACCFVAVKVLRWVLGEVRDILHTDVGRAHRYGTHSDICGNSPHNCP